MKGCQTQYTVAAMAGEASCEASVHADLDGAGCASALPEVLLGMVAAPCRLDADSSPAADCQ